MFFNPTLSYTNHSELGCIWEYGTENASIILCTKPTKNMLRKLRKLSYDVVLPIHVAAANVATKR